MKNNPLIKSCICFIIALLLLLLCLISCSKVQAQEIVTFSITFVAPNTAPTIELAEKYMALEPTHGRLTTDKGVFLFDLEASTATAFRTRPITLEQGKYFISEAVLLDKDGNVTHYMEDRPEDTGKGSAATSWVGETYIFDESSATGYVLKIFYK